MADADLQIKFGADASGLQASLAGVKSALDGLTSGLAGLQSSFAGMASSMSQLATAMQAAGTQAKGAEGAFAGVNKALDGIKTATDQARNVLNLAQDLAKMGAALKDLPALEAAATAGLEGFDVAADANPVGAVVIGLTALAAITYEVVTWLKQLYDTNTNVKAAFDAVGEALKAVWDYFLLVIDVVIRVDEAFANLIGMGLQIYLDQLREGWDLLKTAVEFAWTMIQNAAAAVATFIEKNFGPAIDVITAAWNSLKQAVEDVANMILGALQDAFDWWSQKASDLLDVVGRFLNLHFPEIVGQWGKIVDDLVNSFRDAADAARQVWAAIHGQGAPAATSGGGRSPAVHGGPPAGKTGVESQALGGDAKGLAGGGQRHAVGGTTRHGTAAAAAKPDCGKEEADCEAKALDAKIAGDQQKLAADRANHADMTADFAQYLADMKTRYGEDSVQYRQAVQGQVATFKEAEAEKTDAAKMQGQARVDEGKKESTAIVNEAQKAAVEFSRAWQTAVGSVVSKFTSGIVQMIQGTKSFGQIMAEIGQQMLNGFISKVINPMITRWLLGETTKTAATNVGTAARATTEAIAADKSVATNAMSNLKQIQSDAATAYGKAYKAMAGIPPAPMWGVLAGAAAYAGVMAMEALASAEGGFDIPSGVNPITQLHQNEMVLPATLAMPMRAMLANFQTANFNGPPAANDSGGDTHLHMHVQAMDAQSFRGFLRNNSDHLATVLQEMGRRGMKTG